MNEWEKFSELLPSDFFRDYIIKVMNECLAIKFVAQWKVFLALIECAHFVQQQLHKI